jgi:hypothetical protein
LFYAPIFPEANQPGVMPYLNPQVAKKEAFNIKYNVKLFNDLTSLLFI